MMQPSNQRIFAVMQDLCMDEMLTNAELEGEETMYEKVVENEAPFDSKGARSGRWDQDEPRCCIQVV